MYFSLDRLIPSGDTSSSQCAEIAGDDRGPPVARTHRMSNYMQSIGLDCLTAVFGGAGTRLRNQVRPNVDPISPIEIQPGNLDAPLFGSRGQLNPRQTRNVNAAYEARQQANRVLGRASNSGAVESVQLRGMIERGYDD